MRWLGNWLLGALVVTASAYTPHVSQGGALAADGTKVRPGYTCAVSRDLKHLMGKTIYVQGVGLRYVNDTMHARWRRAIDVCVPTSKDAATFGRQQLKITEVTQ